MKSKNLIEIETNCIITLVLYKKAENIILLSNRHSLLGHEEYTLTNIEDIAHDEFWVKWLKLFNHYEPKDGVYIYNPVWGINVFKDILKIDDELTKTILNIEEGVSLHPEFDHDVKFNQDYQYENEFKKSVKTSTARLK